MYHRVPRWADLVLLGIAVMSVLTGGRRQSPVAEQCSGRTHWQNNVAAEPSGRKMRHRWRAAHAFGIKGQPIARIITETNRRTLVLFEIQNRTLGPNLAAKHRILVSIMNVPTEQHPICAVQFP
jgi:hypothetical protein